MWFYPYNKFDKLLVKYYVGKIKLTELKAKKIVSKKPVFSERFKAFLSG